MLFYDYAVRIDNHEETVKIAKLLGWNGLCIISLWKGKSPRTKKTKDFDLVNGIEMNTRKHLNIVKSIRREVELIVFKGGDIELNRAIVEVPEIDVLKAPWTERNCGLDSTIVKLAKKNNVAIEFNLNELIYSYKTSRSSLLSKLLEASKLIRKYKAPFILTSGAQSAYDLRSPYDLLSFGKVLGFQDPEIKKAMSDFIVRENRKRLSDKWVMPGIEKF